MDGQRVHRAPVALPERRVREAKYECICLNAFETGSEARAGIGRWITSYNRMRPRSAFGGRTPEEVYTACDGINMAA